VQARSLVIDKLMPYREKHEMINAAIEMIKNSNPVATDFLAQMQLRDSERNQNFADNHDDIAKAMGYE
jgi:putative IMPACT (imprinted ancient) family translation regulator